jgi:hypothetical protein
MSDFSGGRPFTEFRLFPLRRALRRCVKHFHAIHPEMFPVRRSLISPSVNKKACRHRINHVLITEVTSKNNLYINSTMRFKGNQLCACLLSYNAISDD